LAAIFATTNEMSCGVRRKQSKLHLPNLSLIKKKLAKNPSNPNLTMTSNHSEIFDHCDCAVENLKQIKLLLEKHEEEQQTLEQETAALRDEKTNLQDSVAGLREQLRHLKSELAENQNDVLYHVYTSNKEQPLEAETDDSSVTDASSSEEEDFFEKSQASIEELKKQLEQLDQSDSVQDVPMDFYTDDYLSASEAETNVGESMPKTINSQQKHQRRLNKRYNSPKKWRRMVRTHRLRSILLNK
jgi:chromosome segregation ATPase